MRDIWALEIKLLLSSFCHTVDSVADGKFCYRVPKTWFVHYLTKFNIWTVIQIIGFILLKKSWSQTINYKRVTL